MQRLLAGLAAAAFSLPYAGAAAASASGDQMAYDLALKCFVAEGVASGDSDDAGKRELAAGYEAKAHASFDTAKVLGTNLGYSGNRITHDFRRSQAYELPLMVKDKAYLHQALATCKAAGLL